jgi:hypothetical protein
MTQWGKHQVIANGFLTKSKRANMPRLRAVWLCGGSALAKDRGTTHPAKPGWLVPRGPVDRTSAYLIIVGQRDQLVNLKIRDG